jgi:uncharacterized membrane protein
MIFFLLLALLTALAALVHRRSDWPQRMRIAMAIALIAAGTDHWVSPERYLPMMPPWIPLHLELVLFTGAAEIAGAFGLLIPRTRTLAGIALGA